MSNPAQPEGESLALVKHVPSQTDDLIAQFEERLEQLREALTDFNAHAVVFIRERPVVCIAGAVAVGYVVGRAAARRWLR